ncbi:MAG TPA: cytochrome c [Usitatibacter sp.]|nr:cytochrome c [Usitatibacter sp.]
MKKAVAIAALCLAATALPASAQQLKPEDQIHLRQSTMALIGYNFKALTDMAKGERPFDKAEAQRAAETLPKLAALPGRFFGEGTEKGGNTKAKPEIWKNMDDFKKKLEHMQNEVAMLPQAAGDLASLKKQVGETGKACKSCHDDYKSK